MGYEMTDLEALADAGFDSVIDVRSPTEFAEDHIPGAINLPVLSDEERARVGTIYTQESPFTARKLGAALVSRNAALHLEGPLANKSGGWRPLVYCWRGGQRSGSFATILSQIGWRAETLVGGYQTYRRLVVERLYDAPFTTPVILLDGNTGTAKTDVLKLLPDHGVQVLDLEGLANHRGSVLGGQGDQPSQKGFETALAVAIAGLDPVRPVVVEAESSKIGELNLPPGLFAAMKDAPRIAIAASVKDRAGYLVRAYADLVSDSTLLNTRLDHLVRLRGHELVQSWKAMAAAGDYAGLAEDLIRHHYDPAYTKSRTRRASEIAEVQAASLDVAGVADLASQVAGLVKQR